MPEKKKERQGTLLGKILLGNVLLVVIILLATLTVTLRYSIQTLERKIEEVLMSTSLSLAKNPTVIAVLESKRESLALNGLLDYSMAITSDLDIITVADMDSLRYFHPNKERIGEYFVGGDEQQVLAGESYLSNALGTMGYQRRAFSPVFASDGGQIGFVMASALMNRIDTMRTEIILLYGKTAVFIFIIGLTITLVLTANIKFSLLGYEPSRFTQIFLAREEVLSVLNEGIISVNRQGEIAFANRAAAVILNIPLAKIEQREIGDILPALQLHTVLESGIPQHNQDLYIAGNTVLHDKIPIHSGAKIIGTVVILRDKTDATRLAEQLTGSRQLINALRANTHDFMNKLHVILGLLQTGQMEEARSCIQGYCQIHSETVNPVLHHVHNPTIAALLLGKVSRMRELNIEFSLLSGSYLPRHSRYLSTQSLVTVVGNLLDNACEAINVQVAGNPGGVTLQITEEKKGLLICVDDTGVGMTQAGTEQIFISGYSTKGQNRGIGMTLIQNILEFCKGDIQVESEKNVGTSITITVKTSRLNDWDAHKRQPASKSCRQRGAQLHD